MDGFELPQVHRKLYFGVIYTGFIRLPATGVYTFYSESNDGSQLYIDDQLVVESDGLHPAVEKAGQSALEKGFHSIRVMYFQNGGVSSLKISYQGPDVEKQIIPPNILFH